jgi:transposase
MVRPPTRAADDSRRLSRERAALLAERIRHANRIKGLLATQGVFDFEPTLRERRARLAKLPTADGASLPPRLRAEILRQVDRLELTMQHLAAVETERDAGFAAERANAAARASGADDTPAAGLPCEGCGARLLRLKGIGPETASVLAGEMFFRAFRNRRAVASYAGLAPSPWQSGGVDNAPGISKAGNARVRKTMGQLAWLWLRNQPDRALSHWYRDRVRDGRGRIKRIAIVALARKLLVALWRFVTQGLVPTGATLKSAKTA